MVVGVRGVGRRIRSNVEGDVRRRLSERKARMDRARRLRRIEREAAEAEFMRRGEQRARASGRARARRASKKLFTPRRSITRRVTSKRQVRLSQGQKQEFGRVGQNFADFLSGEPERKPRKKRTARKRSRRQPEIIVLRR